VQGNVLALFRVHNRTPREKFFWHFLPNLEKSSEPNSGHESFGPSFQSSIAPLYSKNLHFASASVSFGYCLGKKNKQKKCNF
jgi:hypothetical protein